MDIILEPGAGRVEKTDQAVCILAGSIHQTLSADGLKFHLICDFLGSPQPQGGMLLPDFNQSPGIPYDAAVPVPAVIIHLIDVVAAIIGISDAFFRPAEFLSGMKEWYTLREQNHCIRKHLPLVAKVTAFAMTGDFIFVPQRVVIMAFHVIDGFFRGIIPVLVA